MTTGTALAEAEQAMTTAEAFLRAAVKDAYPIGRAVSLRYGSGGNMPAVVAAHARHGRNRVREVGVTRSPNIGKRNSARIWWHDYRDLWPA